VSGAAVAPPPQRAHEPGLLSAAKRDDRPDALWGSFPLSELLILGGVIVLVVGAIRGERDLIIVGVGLVMLSTLETTWREHIAGFRSHTLLLALVPAVAVHAAGALAFGLGASPVLWTLDLAVFGAAAGALSRYYKSVAS
jgi:hypothetical protein